MVRKNVVVSYAREEEPIRDTNVCTAHDCPLPAGMSHQVGGVSDWVCQCHFHAQRGVWSEVTHRINQDTTAVGLIKALRKTKTFDAKGWMVSLQNQGREDLLPTADELIFNKTEVSPRKWLRRVESALMKKAMAGLDSVSSSDTESSEVSESMKLIAKWVHRRQGVTA